MKYTRLHLHKKSAHIRAIRVLFQSPSQRSEARHMPRGCGRRQRVKRRGHIPGTAQGEVVYGRRVCAVLGTCGRISNRQRAAMRGQQRVHGRRELRIRRSLGIDGDFQPLTRPLSAIRQTPRADSCKMAQTNVTIRFV